MTSDPIIQRVRSANPASATPIENTALLEAIVATPPDARLTQDAHARTRRRRSRPTWILAFGAVLCIGGATAWGTGAQSPLGLFQSASKHDDNLPRWRQDVIPGSVHKAATTTIPNVGEVEMWFADSRQGGLCTALRLPDGRWAGIMRAGAPLSPLDRGGTAPDCRPTRSQVNDAGSAIFVIDGLDFEEALVNAPGPGRDVWRVYYGVVDGTRTPVRVVDLVTGRSAPVAEGRFFALAIHDPEPGRLIEKRLVALDARGRRVAGTSEDVEHWRRLYREQQDRHRARSGPEPARSRR
jgi:hypothetical protein